jgi:hypothetical protein
VVRYSPTDLHAQFGEHRFALLQQEHEEHRTPFGTTQKFNYCCFQMDGD